MSYFAIGTEKQPTQTQQERENPKNIPEVTESITQTVEHNTEGTGEAKSKLHWYLIAIPLILSVLLALSLLWLVRVRRKVNEIEAFTGTPPNLS